MAGYDGYSKSNNALQAEAEGRMPLTAAIKAVRGQTGCTAREARAALLHVGPCEWHHTSCKYNRTKYYDVADAAESLPVVRETLAQAKAQEAGIYQQQLTYVRSALEAAKNKLANDPPDPSWLPFYRNIVRDAEEVLRQLEATGKPMQPWPAV